MTLAATVSEALPDADTKPLLSTASAAGEHGPLLAEELAPLIDRIGNRVGFNRVVRLTAFPSHLPERASRPMPALAGAMRFTWPAGPARPLRLFDRPERIEAIPLSPPEHPDNPPERFRWRRVDHFVRTAEGPERIAPEWWAQALPGLPARGITGRSRIPMAGASGSSATACRAATAPPNGSCTACLPDI